MLPARNYQPATLRDHVLIRRQESILNGKQRKTQVHSVAGLQSVNRDAQASLGLLCVDVYVVMAVHLLLSSVMRITVDSYRPVHSLFLVTRLSAVLHVDTSGRTTTSCAD